MAEPAIKLLQSQGVRVAVEGCGHGTLNAIYESVKASCSKRCWDGIDLLIIGGDFQAVRNPRDLNAMSVPAKYRELGDFHEYYSGKRKAPYLTLFIAGNHEASNHLWELFYGGWAAPNIYYMGAANVLRLGPIRIAGLSGIWKGRDYQKTHFERLPFNSDDVKSFYHVREIDVRRLLLMRTQVDVGLSHDWPRGIEWNGNANQLFRCKPYFEAESKDGTLGNPAATYVMDRLRPCHWFSAHLHCKFVALKTHEPAPEPKSHEENKQPTSSSAATAVIASNNDEIDLDMDSDAESPVAAPKVVATTKASDQKTKDVVDESIRAQLPASFAAPPPVSSAPLERKTPGQPVPETIPNTETRFLALDKCLPGRHFLQLLEIPPFHQNQLEKYPPVVNGTGGSRFKLQYDPEWLAINRVFAKHIKVGDPAAENPPDLGEEAYIPLINAEKEWVQTEIVDKNLLDIPENFEVTAPVHIAGEPETVEDLPLEYTNPQTSKFCELLGIPNQWDASEEERAQRQQAGPKQSDFKFSGGSRGRGGGRGGGRGKRGGRGGWGGNKGRDSGRGRGRW
ncbi:Lariat debranching enzyme [Ceratocystis lukuohia]|uniref:Lariat debranching enzyme n=1 Tax=Ceratocystis lukuohia TaxID=2019550 RepID=A0ABR4MRJ7_9PEZI